MKLASCFFVLAVVLATCNAALLSSEVAAQAAIEAAGSDLHPLNGNDVIVSSDFSESEYAGLQALTANEFWRELDNQLVDSEKTVAEASSEHSLLEKPKVAAPKAASGNTPFGLDNDDMIVASAQGETPADKKAKALDDKLFAKDSPFEFINMPLMPAAPANSTALMIKNIETRKKILKRLNKQKGGYMKQLEKLQKLGKMYVEDKDWDEVKIIAKQLKDLHKKMGSWLLQRDAAILLKNSTAHIDGWKDQHTDFIDNVKAVYVKERAAKVKSLRKQFDSYVAAKKTDQIVQMKAHALRALKTDLQSIKGRAMNAFAKKFKEVLCRKFGNKVIVGAIRRGGMKAVRKVTQGKSGVVLIAVAAHLPTVGPYVRAGLVSNKAGNAAFPLIRRW